jgi:hypothetical protein
LLQQSWEVGDAAAVRFEITAEGKYEPAPLPGEARTVPAVPWKIQARCEFDERVLEQTAPGKSPSRVLRRFDTAAVVVGGEVRPLTWSLREELGLIVTERRHHLIDSWSLGGSLTDPEHDLTEIPGDPLVWDALLSEKPVAVGDRWLVGNDAVRSLSGYDAIASHRLEARLESMDKRTARATIGGEIRGARQGAEGTMRIQGEWEFDRPTRQIHRLRLERTEQRKPGQLEAGIDAKSSLRLERKRLDTVPAALDDAVVAQVARALANPDRDLLLYRHPEGLFQFRHDRSWHLAMEDARQGVLKRVDTGEVVAQCNFALGPDAGKGRHQDVRQFQQDIRKALGKNFRRFVEAGPVEDASSQAFRYRVAVEGQQDDLPVIWYYWLVANPDGKQLLLTFTLPAAQLKAFAGQDFSIISSIEWLAQAPKR